tara:strand:- start:805 stop:1026 length:222 start_codon:yes stop_codon:yes gene_type:complete
LENLNVFKYILREIMIMRQLSEIKNNIFTPSLYSIKVSEAAKQDMTKLKNIFLVMEYVPSDLKNLLEIEEQDP